MASSGDVDTSKSFETCFPVISQTPVVLVKDNAGWNDLATSINSGISSGLTTEQFERIGELVFNQKGTYTDIALDIFKNQPPIIVFVAFCAVFSALTLIGAIVTCIWACTCRRSSKGVSSSCMNITGIIIAFISFGFVTAGIVLYSLSVDSFVNGVLKAPDQLGVIVDNAKLFATGATEQISCSVKHGFGGISDDIRNLPDQMITSFEDESVVSDLLKHKYDDLSDSLTNSQPKVQKILDSLTAVRSTIHEKDAGDQVVYAIGVYTVLLAHIVNPNALPKVMKELGGQVSYIKKTIVKTVHDTADPIVLEATGQITKLRNTVENTLNGVRAAINSVMQQVQEVQATITKFEDDLNEDAKVTGWITVGIKALIIVPCAIALLVGFAAFVAGIFLAFKNKSMPSKGCCSGSCMLITFSIIVLAIAFIVMVPASIAMALGYGTQLVCQPFFYDNDLKALPVVDNIFKPFTIRTMAGDQVNLTFSSIMISCKNDASFMRAVKGDQIIDLSDLNTYFNPGELAKQLNDTFEGIDIPFLDADRLKTLNDALDKVEFRPPLNKAQKASLAVHGIMEDMVELEKALSPTIDECKSIAKSAEGLTDPYVFKLMLKDASTSFIFDVSANLTNSANLFTTDLINKSAPCTPVYRSYEDLGLLACEQMTGGVQGMWAAAGLAALFFIPTVIAVFCVASALRGGKGNYAQQVNPRADLF